MTATAPRPSTDGIGDTLRAARGWSLSDLATASGVPVSKIENGLMHSSLVHAINLAAAPGPATKT